MSLDSSSRTRFAQFRTTRWSVVARALSPATGAAEGSLESLCQQYWPPLYAYVRRCGHARHDAQDLTQEFFARLLEKNWLATADRSQGKLRSFLLTAMKRFLANAWDRSQAAKRGGLHAICSMDTEEGEKLVASAAALSEEPAFDHVWALTVMKSTLHRLRAEYEQAGRLREYERIKPALTSLRGEIDYDAIASDLQVLPASARGMVHRLRKRFRELFHDEVADTVATPDEIEGEMRALIAAMGHV